MGSGNRGRVVCAPPERIRRQSSAPCRRDVYSRRPAEHCFSGFGNITVKEAAWMDLGIYGSGGAGKEVYDLLLESPEQRKNWGEIVFIVDTV